MFRHALVALVGLLLVAGSLLAGDKEVKGKVVKVDVKGKVITVMTADGKKDYEVSKETKFVGPKGGVSEKGMEDDRLVPGAEVTLKIAANNRTIREVRLPERKSKDKP